jgi:hypothetical protein
MLKTAVSSNEIIDARNAIDSCEQDFMADDNLLLPILKAFAESTRLLHATSKYMMLPVCV